MSSTQTGGLCRTRRLAPGANPGAPVTMASSLPDDDAPIPSGKIPDWLKARPAALPCCAPRMRWRPSRPTRSPIRRWMYIGARVYGSLMARSTLAATASIGQPTPRPLWSGVHRGDSKGPPPAPGITMPLQIGAPRLQQDSGTSGRLYLASRRILSCTMPRFRLAESSAGDSSSALLYSPSASFSRPI